MSFFYLMSPILLINIFLFIIVLPIIIGVYVYRDANKRGMNPLLWLLITILVPGFLGFILYLVFRADNSLEIICPNCNLHMKRGYDVCPNCLYSLENEKKVYKNIDNSNKKRNYIILLVILIITIPILIGFIVYNYYDSINHYEEVVSLIGFRKLFMI